MEFKTIKSKKNVGFSVNSASEFIQHHKGGCCLTQHPPFINFYYFIGNNEKLKLTLSSFILYCSASAGPQLPEPKPLTL